MESRLHTFVRYVPLLFLLAFPHQVFLIGVAECVAGISIAPYAVIPALSIAIGAGVVIYLGREFLTERMCLALFGVQLVLSLVLILLGCTYLALLHLHRVGSYFYYLYPLQQLLLFAAYALAPAVHVLTLAPQTEGASLLLECPDGLLAGSMGWIHDYRVIGACDAFAGTILYCGFLFFPLSMAQHLSSWESLPILALTQLIVGSSIAMGLVHAREPLVDAHFWDKWPFRFVGSVFAWPVVAGVIGSDFPDRALWLVMIGASPFILRALRLCHLALAGGLRGESIQDSDASVGECLVSEISVQLEAAFPDVILAGRERDCIAMALAGMTSTQIASALGIRPSTVRSYFVRAYRKLGVSDFKGLVERMGEAKGASLEKSEKESSVAVRVEQEEPDNFAILRLPDNARSAFALLLLMVILSDPKLRSITLSFVAVCSIIAGATLSVIGSRCLFLPRTRLSRFLLEGAAISSITVFQSFLTGLQDIALASPAVLLALLVCSSIFIPYLSRMVIFEANMSPDTGSACSDNSFGVFFALIAASSLAISLNYGLREIAFYVLLAIMCVDRFVYACSFVAEEPRRSEAIEEVSQLHIDRFFSVFALGFIVGACMQGVSHIDGALGSDVMLALPLTFILSGCCLYLRRLGHAKRRCVAILVGGFCAIAAGYVLEGSARIGLIFFLVTLWVMISSSRGTASWHAMVHALVFGFSAGASIGLIVFETRFVILQALDELRGVLPVSFDIEFRSLIFMGLLVALSLYVLYEFQAGQVHDSPSLEEGDVRRVMSYCAGRGATDLQGFVVSHIAMGESGRQIARAAGYSVGSVNSARLAAYKLLGVHTRAELLELLRSELNMSEFPPHP